MSRLFQYGLECLSMYSIPINGHISRQEQKDVIDHFAVTFSVLPPTTLRNVFSSQIETLFKQVHLDWRARSQAVISTELSLSL